MAEEEGYLFIHPQTLVAPSNIIQLQAKMKTCLFPSHPPTPFLPVSTPACKQKWTLMLITETPSPARPLL